MSLQLTGEQRAMVDTVRDFCAKEFGTRAQRMALTEGGANPHNRDIAAKMGSLGWLGLSIPESCGGSGGGLFEACLFVEALSHGRAPLSSYPVTLIVAHTYLKFASEPIKQQVLGGVAAGAVTSIAMSEPGSGSDVASLRCKAVKTPTRTHING